MKLRSTPAFAAVAALVTLVSACSAANVQEPPVGGDVIAIRPPIADVTVGDSVKFAVVGDESTGPVSWSVVESGGGTVDSAGNYVAPDVGGTFRVVASVGEQGSPAEAIVRVHPRGIDPVPTGPQLFVATDGDDSNPGTEAQPWRTIQKAMNSATPGSTVNIRGGTYRELLTTNVSGSPGNPITFQPYGFVGSPSCGGYTGTACPGERVVLDYSSFGTLTTTKPALLIAGKSNITIQGLVFQNYAVDGPMHVGILVNGWSRDVAFRWNRVENFKNVHPDAFDATTMLAVFRAGWISTGADNVTVSYNQFYDSKTNMAEVLSWDLGSAGGVAERNHVRDCDGIAIHTYRGAHHFTFRENLVEWAGVKRDGSLPYPNRGDTGIALYNDGGRDGLIEGNVVRNSGYGLESLAENAASGGGAQPPVYNIIVRNNVFIGNHYGMMIGTWYSSTDGSSVHHHDIYNNTIYGGNVGIYVRPFDAATVKVRNNVVAGTGTPYVNPLGWNVQTSFDYNLYTGGRGPDAQQVNADPMFANPAAGDLALLPGSPAIDAGDPTTSAASAGDTDLLGAPRFVGARINLGAIEGR